MAHKEMKAELTCPICMELFRQPRRLPCGHAYCHRCISTLLQVRAQQLPMSSRRLVCPECRDEMQIHYVLGIEALPLDFKLSRLVELVRNMEAASTNSDNADTNSTTPGPVQGPLETRPSVASPSSPLTGSTSTSPLTMASPSLPPVVSPLSPPTTSPSSPPTASSPSPALVSPFSPITSSQSSSLSSSPPPLPPLTITPGIPSSGYYFIGPDGNPFTASFPPGFVLFPDLEDDGSPIDLAEVMGPRTEYDDYLDTLSYRELWNEAGVALDNVLESFQNRGSEYQDTSNRLTELRTSSPTNNSVDNHSSLSSSLSSLRAGRLSSSSLSSSTLSDEEHPTTPWSQRASRIGDMSSTTAVVGDSDNNDAFMNLSSPATTEENRHMPLRRLLGFQRRDNNAEPNNETVNEIVESNNEARNELGGSSIGFRRFQSDNVDSNNESRDLSQTPRENVSDGEGHLGRNESQSQNAEAFRQFLRFRHRLPELEKSSTACSNDNVQVESDLQDSSLNVTSLIRSQETEKGKDNFKIKYLKLKKRVVHIFKDTYSTTESSDEEIEQERVRQREKEQKKEEEKREKQQSSAEQKKFNRERRKWRMTRRLMSLILSDDSSSSEDDSELNRHRNSRESGSNSPNQHTERVEIIPASDNDNNTPINVQSGPSWTRRNQTPSHSDGEGRGGGGTIDPAELITRTVSSLRRINTHSGIRSPLQEAYPVPSIPPLLSTYDNVNTADNSQIQASSRESNADISTSLETPSRRNVSVCENTHPTAEDDSELNRHRNSRESGSNSPNQHTERVEIIPVSDNDNNTPINVQSGPSWTRRNQTPSHSDGEGRGGNETSGSGLFGGTIDPAELIVQTVSFLRCFKTHSRIRSPLQEAYPVPSIPPLLSTYDNVNTADNSQVQASSRQSTTDNSSSLEAPSGRNVSVCENTHPTAEHYDNTQNPNHLSLDSARNSTIRDVPTVVLQQSDHGSDGVEMARQRLASECDGGGTFYDNICEDELSGAVGGENLGDRIVLGRGGDRNRQNYGVAVDPEIADLKTGIDDGRNDVSALEQLRVLQNLNGEEETIGELTTHQGSTNNLTGNAMSARGRDSIAWKDICDNYEIESLKDRRRKNEWDGSATVTQVKQVASVEPQLDGTTRRPQEGTGLQLDRAKALRPFSDNSSAYHRYAASFYLYDRVNDNGYGGSSNPETRGVTGTVIDNDDNGDESDVELAAPNSAMLKNNGAGGDSGESGSGMGKKSKSRFRKFISSLMWLTSSSSSSDEDDRDCSDV